MDPNSFLLSGRRQLVCRLIAATVLTATAGTWGGCAARQVQMPGTDTVAMERGGTVEMFVPGEFTPATVAASAEATMRRRGYVIVSSDISEDRSAVVARLSSDGWLERTRINADRTCVGTRVRVRVAPLGNTPTSLGILDEMLAMLGFSPREQQQQQHPSATTTQALGLPY